MDIKKADSKGRLTVGEDGKVYSVEKHGNGAITLHPINIPAPGEDLNPATDLRAIYWDPSGSSRPDTVTIYSVLGGGLKANAEMVARWANELKVPVVVNGYGYGAAAADILREKAEYDVIEKRR